MRVLGIDPGSQTTGWGVVEGDGRRYSLVAYGSIRASSSLKFSTRLLKMCTGIEEVIAEHRPDACALEDAFLATNVKVSMKLGQVRGVVLLLKLKSVPSPHDAADALAVAICHFHHAAFKERIAAV